MAWFSSSILLASQAPIKRFKRCRGTVSEYVIEVRNTGNRQSLSATEKHLGGQITDGSRNQRDYDSTNVFENSISGQDNDGSATHG
jgi:hypothetical protein